MGSEFIRASQPELQGPRRWRGKDGKAASARRWQGVGDAVSRGRGDGVLAARAASDRAVRAFCCLRRPIATVCDLGVARARWHPLRADERLGEATRAWALVAWASLCAAARAVTAPI